MSSGLWRYDGRRVVVTGCASGIGAELTDQLADLGAEVVGLDRRRPARVPAAFHAVDLADPTSIDRVADHVGGPVDDLFHVAGVSSGIGNPREVVEVNYLGPRHLTTALLPRMRPGASIVTVSSLAAADYQAHSAITHGLVSTSSVADGRAWCDAHPEELADGGYRLSKEAIILDTIVTAPTLAPRGVRVNCSCPGVTETPILDDTRRAYGQDFIEAIPKPLGRVAHPAEQAAVLAFLGSPAAGYLTGEVLWVDGGRTSGLRARQLAGTPESTAFSPVVRAIDASRRTDHAGHQDASGD